MLDTPKWLYKVLSLQNWRESKEFLLTPSEDSPFIHFATEEQLERVIAKFFSDREFVVLKVDVAKISGQLVYEANPGGTTKYYHLYHGAIPKTAVIEVKFSSL